MNKILFSERQHARWAYFTILSSLILLTLAYHYGWGTNPIPLAGYITLMVVFIGIFLLFCKMDTTINEEKIEIKYGIFGFRKIIPLHEIQTVQQKKYRFIYGVGIRMLPEGVLYSVNLSKMVEITIKDNLRTISIGTDKAEEMVQVLQTIATNNT